MAGNVPLQVGDARSSPPGRSSPARGCAGGSPARRSRRPAERAGHLRGSSGCCASQPERIFAGHRQPGGLADLRGRSRRRAAGRTAAREPAPFLVTFFTGQPMLMSMICAPYSLPMTRGLRHHLGLAAEDLQRVGPLHLGVVAQVPQRSAALARISPWALTSSVGHSAAPIRKASTRNGCSLTPPSARGCTGSSGCRDRWRSMARPCGRAALEPCPAHAAAPDG